MTGRATAATRLERALVKDAGMAGVTLTIATIRSTRWASATFAGARHRLEVMVAGAGARDWLAGLAEADLPMPAHLVADVVLVEQHHASGESRAVVEILTVEDGV
ncbi:hypothetical protein ASE86_02905 [Sphingomonas sp. Leaf33]|uniref:hypothetical protein n=1 Tax=Sphingomonas sp. Leaf33 TaxID=1736215 RepID=UPI0006F63C76|nr:hypothetical protein [Sphingomonas sp. Leaf33]KQN25222.1 hypothetical protein ASE86_02905 [Sphingomonas sp. Leaf33]